jgi:hypothetical protein
VLGTKIRRATTARVASEVTIQARARRRGVGIDVQLIVAIVCPNPSRQIGVARIEDSPIIVTTVVAGLPDVICVIIRAEVLRHKNGVLDGSNDRAVGWWFLSHHRTQPSAQQQRQQHEH